MPHAAEMSRDCSSVNLDFLISPPFVCSNAEDSHLRVQFREQVRHRPRRGRCAQIQGPADAREATLSPLMATVS
jgi:hypothetical protein